mgnify:CR=1 FL=1
MSAPFSSLGGGRVRGAERPEAILKGARVAAFVCFFRGKVSNLCREQGQPHRGADRFERPPKKAGEHRVSPADKSGGAGERGENAADSGRDAGQNGASVVRGASGAERASRHARHERRGAQLPPAGRGGDNPQPPLKAAGRQPKKNAPTVGRDTALPCPEPRRGARPKGAGTLRRGGGAPRSAQARGAGAPRAGGRVRRPCDRRAHCTQQQD